MNLPVHSFIEVGFVLDENVEVHCINPSHKNGVAQYGAIILLIASEKYIEESLFGGLEQGGWSVEGSSEMVDVEGLCENASQ